MIEVSIPAFIMIMAVTGLLAGYMLARRLYK